MENDNLLEHELTESKRLGRDMSSTVRRRLFFWSIRWIIGFGAIACVVYVKPGWAWLWYVGIGIAGLSLVSMIVGNMIIQRKVGRIEKSIAEIRTLADEIDAEENQA